MPADHENWLQCHECGTVVPVYEIEKEASIKDVVETIDNPFDNAKDQFLGVDSRKARRKKRLDKQKYENYDHIKEPEIREQLTKGAILLSYSQED